MSTQQEPSLLERQRHDVFANIKNKIDNLIADYNMYKNGLSSIDDNSWNKICNSVKRLENQINKLDKIKFK